MMKKYKDFIRCVTFGAGSSYSSFLVCIAGLACSNCSRHFSSKRGLAAHRNFCTKSEEAPEATPPVLSCRRCSATFNHTRYLRLHHRYCLFWNCWTGYWTFTNIAFFFVTGWIIFLGNAFGTNPVPQYFR